MPTYASGEHPEIGDIVTKRGYKPTRPATVLEVIDGLVSFVTVRWGDSKGTMKYAAEELVLVQPAESYNDWYRREVVGMNPDEQF